jgi:hypothetical protein
VTRREPHIHTAGLDAGQRPFECYQDQPDTAERVRLQVQSIPFGLPEKVIQTDPGAGCRSPLMPSSVNSAEPSVSVHAAAAPDPNVVRRSPESSARD